jgi:hypothetical protein
MELVFEAGEKALSAPSRGVKGENEKGADRSSTLNSTFKGGT